MSSGKAARLLLDDTKKADTPIPLLAKVSVHDLQIHVGRSGLSLDDTVALSLDAQGRVIVTAMVRQRVLGVFG
jgi:hypothetical protein